MAEITAWFRSWRLRSWRTAAVAALVLYALAGFFLVPWLAKKLIVSQALARTGRTVTVEDVRCNPFTLSLTVRGFAMPDRPGSTMLSFSELYANAELSSLFRWAVTLKELRIEEPFVALRRFEDGGVNVVELMRDIEARTPSEPEPREKSGLPRALLQHVEATDASIEIENRALAEALRVELGPARFELHDISTIPRRQGGHDFVIGLPQGGELKIAGNVVVEPLGVDGRVEWTGAFLELAWPEIKELFNFDLVGGRVEGRFDYAAALDERGLRASVENADISLRDLALDMRSDGARVLELPSVNVTGGAIRWPEAVIGAESVVVERPVARTWIGPDGTPGVLELMPRAAEQRVEARARELEARMHWVLDLGRLELAGARAEIEDRTMGEPILHRIDEASLVLTDILTRDGARWGIEASALVNASGRGTVKGEVSAVPLFADLEVGLQGLEIGGLRGYVERFAPIELRSGTVRSAGRLHVEPDGRDPDLVFEGSFAIDRIDLVETVLGSQILEWGLVEADGIRATYGPTSLRVAGCDIHGAGIDVVVNPEGRVNLLELLLAMAQRRQEAQAGSARLPPIRIDALRLHDCGGAYIDQTMSPEFRLALERVNGGLTAISSEGDAGAAIDIKGEVPGGGLVAIGGEIDVFDPGRLSELGIDCREVALPPLSPMAVRFIGHPFASGAATLNLDYGIAARQLTGNNLLVTDGMKLGDKVEGEGLMNLPFKLGVSLLTDKNGLVTLEFPIAGSLDDPSFGVGNAIQAAVKEVISELLKSPFRLLAKLGGGSGDEDLGFVEFEAGSSELEVTAIAKLRTLAVGAGERPGLVLQMQGTWDPDADPAALKAAAFETLVAERLAAADAAAGDRELTASLELLEALAGERLGAEPTAALRARHTSAPPAAEGAGDAAEPILDETAYYRELRSALITAQPLDPAALPALAAARAEAIRGFLVEDGGLEPARAGLLDPEAVEEGSGDGWVRCRLEVAALE